MAQIITLKDIQHRNSGLNASLHASKVFGPAQVLLFTGVRYERYDSDEPKANGFRAKSPRKRSSKH